MAFYGDTDAQETQEWQDAFDSVLQHMVPSVQHFY